MQQLEARIVLYAHPYDAGAPKVRERADAADGISSSR